MGCHSATGKIVVLQEVLLQNGRGPLKICATRIVAHKCYRSKVLTIITRALQEETKSL